MSDQGFNLELLHDRIKLLYDPAMLSPSEVFAAAVGAHAEVGLAIGAATRRLVGEEAMNRALEMNRAQASSQVYLNLLYENAKPKRAEAKETA